MPGDAGGAPVTGVPGPLHGIRVLDVSRVVAGPMAALYLASLGAKVIRVEMPGGDLTWRVPPFFGAHGEHRGVRAPDEVAIGTIKRNRGKRNIVLDLKVDAARDVFRRLVAVSDVVVENLRPGVLDRLGVGYAASSQLNPRVVWCSITGFGQFGPYRDRQAMDFTMQAISGVQAHTGFPDGPPTKSSLLAGDLAPATFAALGAVAALFERERTGRGQLVDVAMHDVVTSWLWDEPLDAYEDAGEIPRPGNRELRGSPSNTYRCADGWVNIVVVGDPPWPRLAALIGRADLAVHDNNQKRLAVNDEIDRAIGAWCAPRAGTDIEAALVAIDVPVAFVQPPWVARRDPHVAARRSIVPLVDQHGRSTGYLGPRFPVHLSTGEVELAPPEPLGGGTDEVLGVVLGLAPGQIEALREAGALG
ncbi:MAG TPA: CoA transferase [Acidimicrobiales bacterium]|jgi:crotonobetainyl-CoA:carnitine CoA-transferase CaiB-like acyl-CoA transferase|nr:CoA transferase [Acidimicrobiales bacterium]